MRLGRKGFTLTELIVVIVIIGVLAAISVPAMTANVDRARRSEAIAALGALRSSQKLYYSEKSVYAGTRGELASYIATGDLNGRYYNEGNYVANATQLRANGGSAGLNVNMEVVSGSIDNP